MAELKIKIDLEKSDIDIKKLLVKVEGNALNFFSLVALIEQAYGYTKDTNIKLPPLLCAIIEVIYQAAQEYLKEFIKTVPPPAVLLGKFITIYTKGDLDKMTISELMQIASMYNITNYVAGGKENNSKLITSILEAQEIWNGDSKEEKRGSNKINFGGNNYEDKSTQDY